MQIKVEEGTFKVITGVTATTVVNVTNREGKVVDSFGFGLSKSGELSTEAFIGNATVDGKIAFIRQVDTDDKDVIKNLKEVYGRQLVRAEAFEVPAMEQNAAAAEAEAQYKATLSEMFGESEDDTAIGVELVNDDASDDNADDASQAE